MQQALTTKIGEGQVNWILIVELQNFQHCEPNKEDNSYSCSRYARLWARDSLGCVLVRRGDFWFLKKNWRTNTKRLDFLCVSSILPYFFPGITRHPWYSPDVPWGRTHRHQQNVLAKVRFHLLFNCSNNCDHNVPAEFHKSYQIWIWSYAVNVGACRPWILREDGRTRWHSCCGVWGQVQCSSYNLMC